MPRVKARKVQYMMADYSKWIKGKMGENDTTLEELGNLINLSKSQVCRKLKEGKFTLQEIIIIMHYYKAEPEDLQKLILY